MKYDAEWKGFDRGREAFTAPDMWLETLRILANHEGHPITQIDGPLYRELERRLPEITWVGEGDRSFFRGYQQPWTLSGVLVPTKETGGVVQVTSLGHDLLEERLTHDAVWVQAMAMHEETLAMEAGETQERPFAVLAESFLALGMQPISFDQLYFGVMRGWRPGDGDLQAILDQTPGGEEIPATRGRRLRAMLKKMTQVGAIEEVWGDRWRPRSSDILRPIAEGSALSDRERTDSASDEDLGDETERDLAAFARDLDALPIAPREKVLRAIAARRGQPAFRRRLLKLYQGRCALTRWDAEKALEAAHIVPWSDDGEDSPRNGMLLRADVHTLFDLHYVSVDPSQWRVYVADPIADTRYGELQGQHVELPLSKVDWPATDYLQEHFKRTQS